MDSAGGVEPQERALWRSAMAAARYLRSGEVERFCDGVDELRALRKERAAAAPGTSSGGADRQPQPRGVAEAQRILCGVWHHLFSRAHVRLAEYGAAAAAYADPPGESAAAGLSSDGTFVEWWRTSAADALLAAAGRLRAMRRLPASTPAWQLLLTAPIDALVAACGSDPPGIGASSSSGSASSMSSQLVAARETWSTVVARCGATVVDAVARALLSGDANDAADWPGGASDEAEAAVDRGLGDAVTDAAASAGSAPAGAAPLPSDMDGMDVAVSAGSTEALHFLRLLDVASLGDEADGSDAARNTDSDHNEAALEAAAADATGAAPSGSVRASPVRALATASAASVPPSAARADGVSGVKRPRRAVSRLCEPVDQVDADPILDTSDELILEAGEGSSSAAQTTRGAASQHPARKRFRAAGGGRHHANNGEGADDDSSVIAIESQAHAADGAAAASAFMEWTDEDATAAEDAAMAAGRGSASRMSASASSVGAGEASSRRPLPVMPSAHAASAAAVPAAASKAGASSKYRVAASSSSSQPPAATDRRASAGSGSGGGSGSGPRASDGKRRQKRYWTADEESALLQGVRRFGEGKWSAILSAYSGVFTGNARTQVDLKDKYKNILKASGGTIKSL